MAVEIDIVNHALKNLKAEAAANRPWYIRMYRYMLKIFNGEI